MLWSVRYLDDGLHYVGGVAESVLHAAARACGERVHLGASAGGLECHHLRIGTYHVMITEIGSCCGADVGVSYRTGESFRDAVHFVCKNFKSEPEGPLCLRLGV